MLSTQDKDADFGGVEGWADKSRNWMKQFNRELMSCSSFVLDSFPTVVGKKSPTKTT